MPDISPFNDYLSERINTPDEEDRKAIEDQIGK
jgi:hypothetical protein